MQAASFYRYVSGKHNKSSVRSALKAMGVLGRVYVSPEGINGQCIVPLSSRQEIELLLKNEWGTQVNWGEVINGIAPFEKLSVKYKTKLVNDGLEVDVNLRDSGVELTPSEWHDSLEKADLVIDCRNNYEHAVGRFDKSTGLSVQVFRETFNELKPILEKHSLDSNIFIYCTGGIRCEKVGAYLKYKGYQHVNKLEGGIVKYVEFIRNKPNMSSKFRGRNFVFDQRLCSDRIGVDKPLTVCRNCGVPHDLFRNCSSCGKLLLQCNPCASSFSGTCGDDEICMREMKSDHIIRFKSDIKEIPVYSDIDLYASHHSTALERLDHLNDLRNETETQLPRSHMMSNNLQGQLLRFLLSTTQAKYVLELGCFSGFSASCLIQAMKPGGELHTCDIDEGCLKVASAFLKKTDPESMVRIHHMGGLELLENCRKENRKFDLIFVDANKKMYKEYFEKILQWDLLDPSGLMIFDNTLFKGSVLNPHPKEKIAKSLDTFNKYIAQDCRVFVVMLPMLDGLTLVRRHI